MNSFSLKAYTASAISFLALHREADCQVVYVDIDPDIILSEGGQVAELDLDQNGTIDFWFHNNSFFLQYYTYDGGTTSFTRQNILIGPEIDGNLIAGDSEIISLGYTAYARFYPYALDFNQIINDSLSFQAAELQILALRSIDIYGGLVGFGFNCNWYNLEITERIDHYIGINFGILELTNVFGWIRCDVKNEGRTLVIKDYAYEMTPDYPIIAGDTIHYIDIIDSIPNSPVIIYSFNELLYISLKDSVETQVTIVNLAGQKINSFETVQKQNTMDLSSLASGIYIVSAEYEGQVYSTKVLIH